MSTLGGVSSDGISTVYTDGRKPGGPRARGGPDGPSRRRDRGLGARHGPVRWGARARAKLRGRQVRSAAKLREQLRPGFHSLIWGHRTRGEKRGHGQNPPAPSRSRRGSERVPLPSAGPRSGRSFRMQDVATRRAVTPPSLAWPGGGGGPGPAERVPGARIHAGRMRRRRCRPTCNHYDRRRPRRSSLPQ